MKIIIPYIGHRRQCRTKFIQPTRRLCNGWEVVRDANDKWQSQ